jgi:acyl carrier protein
MTNIEKLNQIFCEVFSVDVSALGAGFDNKAIDGWDSVRQLSLTSAVEDAFDIMLDPEDILEFTSYDNAKAILQKYDIAL